MELKKAHTAKLTAKQIKEKQNNKVYALVKFGTMVFSYIITLLTCNDFSNLSMSFLVMSLTIGSDMLIILLTTNKNSAQFNISFAITIYSCILIMYTLLSCFKLIHYDSNVNEIFIGQDLSFGVYWKSLKLVNGIAMFILISVYSLEHTGILKMPNHQQQQVAIREA